MIKGMTRWISCLHRIRRIYRLHLQSPVWRNNVVHRGCLQQKLSDAAVRQAAGLLHVCHRVTCSELVPLRPWRYPSDQTALTKQDLWVTYR
jgi:hypothetical protein